MVKKLSTICETKCWSFNTNIKLHRRLMQLLFIYYFIYIWHIIEYHVPLSDGQVNSSPAHPPPRVGKSAGVVQGLLQPLHHLPQRQNAEWKLAKKWLWWLWQWWQWGACIGGRDGPSPAASCGPAPWDDAPASPSRFDGRGRWSRGSGRSRGCRTLFSSPSNASQCKGVTVVLSKCLIHWTEITYDFLFAYHKYSFIFQFILTHYFRIITEQWNSP